MSILTHTVGLDERHDEPWRNHYVTDAPDKEMVGLIERGLMVERPKPSWCIGRLFMATEAGKAAAVAEHAAAQAAKPKPTRSQARYLRWLSLSDAWDISFGDWLRRGCP